MPRKLRIEYSGAMYHVMSRGDRREKIYLDDVDRQDFIKTLAEASKCRFSLLTLINRRRPRLARRKHPHHRAHPERGQTVDWSHRAGGTKAAS
jgi:hypothetical protein